eukprot:1137343-Pelagomonas_calceolata.AAC.11
MRSRSNRRGGGWVLPYRRTSRGLVMWTFVQHKKKTGCRQITCHRFQEEKTEASSQNNGLLACVWSSSKGKARRWQITCHRLQERISQALADDMSQVTGEETEATSQNDRLLACTWPFRKRKGQAQAGSLKGQGRRIKHHMQKVHRKKCTVRKESGAEGSSTMHRKSKSVWPSIGGAGHLKTF